MTKFKLGDYVVWDSAANGAWKTKSGKIIEVIPANTRGRYRRDHESYLVEVHVGTTGRAKPKVYWPRVNALSLHPLGRHGQA